MKKVDGYMDADANQGSERKQLPAGGYVCKITHVVDVPEKEYLKIEFDIADGQYIGWYADIYERASFWGGKMVRSYKETALGFFKGFITAVENSNRGYAWSWDEQSLVGKFVGLVIGYEEYEGNDGSIKTRTYVAQNRSVDAIRNNEFTVPDLKKLSVKPSTNKPVFTATQNTRASDDEIPPWM